MTMVIKIDRHTLQQATYAPSDFVDKEVHIDIQDVSSAALETLLQKMQSQPLASLTLRRVASLSAEQLQSLVTYIKAQKNGLSFPHLSLCVDSACIQGPHFKTLLQALEYKPLQSLHIVFSAEDLSDPDLENILNQHLAPGVHYPVIIESFGNHAVNMLPSFEDNVILRMQRYNQANFLNLPLNDFYPESQQAAEEEAPQSQGMKEKFKLKSLIYADPSHQGAYSNYISLEIQHTEVAQQQVQEVSEIIQTEVNEVVQERDIFEGELIDFDKFQNYKDRVLSSDLMQVFRDELFGNIPHAIKFLSHEAALLIAEQAPAFVTLNADNLPFPFVLKATPQGEWVLDVDSNAVNTHTNVFTPKALRKPPELIYRVTLPEALQKQAIMYFGTESKRLDNVWARYGDVGVKVFFDLFERCDKAHPGFSQFLMKHYFNRFSQLDSLLDDKRFLNTMNQLNNYDKTKLDAFKAFIVGTDATTPFDLTDTVNGFEVFWTQWLSLAQKANLEPHAILNTWSQKKAGNPLVYMERLLTILKNARDLREQLSCLDKDGLTLWTVPNRGKLLSKASEALPGLEERNPSLVKLHEENKYVVYGSDAKGHWRYTDLSAEDAAKIEAAHLPFPAFSKSSYVFNRTEVPFNLENKFACLIISNPERNYHCEHPANKHALDNYGAYYASKYEGFKIVAKAMDLHYDPNQPRLFEREAGVYRKELDQLQPYFSAKHEKYMQGFFKITLKDAKERAKKAPLYLLPMDDRYINVNYKGTIGKKAALQAIESKYGQPIPYTGQAITPSCHLYQFRQFEHESYSYYSLSKMTLCEESIYDAIVNMNLTADQLYAMACRYLGQQNKSIDINKFIYGVWAFDAERGGNYVLSVLLSLFFVSHERYTGTVDLHQLLRNIEGMECHKEVLLDTIQAISKLYQHDTRLNDAEGNSICQRIAKLNSVAFERMHLSKEYYIQKLFAYLQTNKYATLKMINHLVKNPDSKHPFVYALDTADCLLAHSTLALRYPDDLLLFSLLINSESDELFCATAQNDVAAALKRENVKKVESILLKAALAHEPNSLDYAFKALVQSESYFSYKDFLNAFAEIDALPEFNARQVEAILKSPKYKFKLSASQPALFARDSVPVKQILVSLLIAIERGGEYGLTLMPPPDKSLEIQSAKENLQYDNDNPPSENQEKKEQLLHKITHLKEEQAKYQAWKTQFDTLYQQPTRELQEKLNRAWEKSGTMLSYVARSALTPLLNQLRTACLNEAFETLGHSSLATLLQRKLHDLSDFKEAIDFDKISRIDNQAISLAERFAKMMQNSNVNAQEQVFVNALTIVDFTTYDYETLWALINQLVEMPNRNYAHVLNTFFTVSRHQSNAQRLDLVADIAKMHNLRFPSMYIEHYLSLASNPHDLPQLHVFLQQCANVFGNNVDDELLQWLFSTKTLTLPCVTKLSELTCAIEEHRTLIQDVIQRIHRNNAMKAFLKTLENKTPETTRKVLEIMAISQATTLKTESSASLDYVKLSTLLIHLSEAELNELHTFITQSKISIACLTEGLNTRDATQPFTKFLQQFEKVPFGKRDLSTQFDISEVERVVNGTIDSHNQSIYPYSYRKHMMEAFLFVNHIGNDLAIYQGKSARRKSARELSNQEIRELFHAIKEKKFAHLDAFQNRLLALGLMREAMYRSTGQFPYSTQILALIDCAMHPGDFLENIDTGQGKSLVDIMKASLLWLSSDKVNMTTSALADVQHDLEIYSPYLLYLGISHAKEPVLSSSTFDTYSNADIVYTTLSQLALLSSRAKAEQVTLVAPNAIVSWVMNESDYTILDDRTIYRYASTGGPDLLGQGHEWVYDAINDFIDTDQFKADLTSKAEDIEALRNFLVKEAQRNKKSPQLIDSMSDEKLSMWIDSALIVAYRLRENFDFVLTPEAEPKSIYGKLQLTRSAKILMKDGRVSPDTQYGNGQQQLLYARLNKKYGSNSFLIEPESKTIISLNNKNMIDYYRSKQGYIWGSTGTVGSDEEIAQQFCLYGFDVSIIPTHQARIVTEHEPIILSSEAVQFPHILEIIKASANHARSIPPALVYLKDIDTANRFYAYLQRSSYDKRLIQSFTGLGDEKTITQCAKIPGMITVTTSAIERNLDVKYDRSLGLTVVESYVSSVRGGRQKKGRTGRQGSRGDVYYVLNNEDLNNQSIADIQRLFNKKAEKEREFNENLYNILGGLLSYVDQVDKSFFKEKWSRFSETLEAQYRQLKLNNVYNDTQFLQDSVAAFNQLTGQAVVVAELKAKIGYLHQKRAPYLVSHKAVALADCTSSEVIAYHFLSPAEGTLLYSKAEVKAKLKRIFDYIDLHFARPDSYVNSGHLQYINSDYLQYLSAGTSSMAVIHEAHQEFLAEWLNQQVDVSQKASFFARWLGYEGHLTQITDSQYYLPMFKALLDASRQEKTMEPNMEMNCIRSSITTLLQEYLDYSWFVNASRKQAVADLLSAVNQADNLNSLVDILSKSKIDAIVSDVEANQQSWFRTIKPINFFGHSRFQSTLDKALALSYLVVRHENITLIPGLTKAFSAIAGEPVLPPNSMDELSAIIQSDKLKDEGNAKVIESSMEAFFKHKDTFEHKNGMQGRFMLFEAPQPLVDDDKENQSLNQNNTKPPQQ